MSIDDKASAAGVSGASDDSQGRLGVVLDYVAIARPDHWFKNGFMLFGMLLAWCYYYGKELTERIVFEPATALLALAATCFLASSNYVINEILDAPTDRSHPVKHRRPIPSGRIRLPIAYIEWIALAILGGGLAWLVNPSFFLVALLFLAMGLIYNVPPVRTKEVPYLDVLTESINNPIRLALGWLVVRDGDVPPMSLLVSYWMVGAFFMATKRFAEYRSIGDPDRAAAYRRSFRHCDDNRLLVSMFFYATAAALFLGVFIIRYRLELILSIPLIAGFFAYYMHIALRPDSPVQAPERLFRDWGLMAYLAVCMIAFLGLLVIEVRPLYEIFNVDQSSIPRLWRLR